MTKSRMFVLDALTLMAFFAVGGATAGSSWGGATLGTIGGLIVMARHV